MFFFFTPKLSLFNHVAVFFVFGTFLDIACGVSFVAFLSSFSQHITVTLIASLFSFLAAILALIAFAIDIALYAYFKNQMGNLGFGGNTITGPGMFVLLTCNHVLTRFVKASGSPLLR